MGTFSLVLAAALTLSACGGGSAPGGVATPANINTGVPVSTSGAITAFGSVYVNGVRYDVSAARLKKNGAAVTQSALAVGEIAEVLGRQNQSGDQG